MNETRTCACCDGPMEVRARAYIFHDGSKAYVCGDICWWAFRTGFVRNRLETEASRAS